VIRGDKNKNSPKGMIRKERNKRDVKIKETAPEDMATTPYGFIPGQTKKILKNHNLTSPGHWERGVA